MLIAGFEPTIPVFERSKTIRILDRNDTVSWKGYAIVEVTLYIASKKFIRLKVLMIVLLSEQNTTHSGVYCA